MRISTHQVLDSSLANINDAYSRLDTAQQKISSGTQINAPSDNPVGVQQVLEFKARLAENEQYTKTLNQAKGILATTETAMSSIDTITRQVRSLAVQAANGTLDQNTLPNLANQVQDAINQVGSIGNSTYGQQYIFGGQRTGTAPLQAAGTTFTYTGGTQAKGNDAVNLDIGRSESLTVNVSGDKVLTPLLATLTKVRDDVASGATSEISITDLAQLDVQLNNIVNTRADIGSKINRITSETQRNDLTKINYTQLMSTIQDTNIPQAVIDLQSAQTAYQAAIQSTAKTFQNSLLDYLK